MARVLEAILTHQSAECVAAMLEWWRGYVDLDRVLIVAGGTREDFEAIAHPHKVFVADRRLRTRDHQRECQGYVGVYCAIADWFAGRDFSHVFFVEYDHLPLDPAFEEKLLARLTAEDADVLGHHVQRVDGSNQPHYLHHRHNSAFHPHWQKITRRAAGDVILNMFGSGSFWTRAAFEAVARTEEPFPIYLELYLPTLAHHLGYRVRGLPEQDAWVQVWRDLEPELEKLRAAGAWTAHPVKHRWTRAAGGPH